MRLLAALLALATALGACGGGDEAQQPATPAAAGTSTAPATTSTDADRPPPKGEPTKPAETPPGDPRLDALEREAARAVRGYVDGLNARDGAAVCALFVPGSLDAVELPEQRGDCASSLTASIGYRDPRGLPVWERAKLDHLRVAELNDDGRAAKVIATVKTTFADRDEISTEDDVVYLSRAGGTWLIAKPSATLYRAIGVGDIPASVLAPPSG